MDLKNCIENIQESTEMLIAEAEYFENRVNSKSATKDDRACVIEDIQDCRKKLNDLINKVKGIAIIKPNKGE